jgi:hypothetical protein
MPNGNVFVALSGQYMYEVNSSGQTVWQYNAGPQKAFRYTCDHPGVAALLGADPCGLATDVDAAQATGPWSLYPNPARGTITMQGLDVGTMERFLILDATGREVARQAPDWTIDMSDLPPGPYHVVVEHSTGARDSRLILVEN